MVKNKVHKGDQPSGLVVNFESLLWWPKVHGYQIDLLYLTPFSWDWAMRVDAKCQVESKWAGHSGEQRETVVYVTSGWEGQRVRDRTQAHSRFWKARLNKRAGIFF